jgi:hypothetical protein
MLKSRRAILERHDEDMTAVEDRDQSRLISPAQADHSHQAEQAIKPNCADSPES